jgi:hypothetical protein
VGRRVRRNFLPFLSFPPYKRFSPSLFYSRLNQVEQRLSSLEDTSSNSQALIRQQQQQQGSALLNNSLMSDHERRIAALESQLYALQLAASRPPPLPSQDPPQGSLPTIYSSPSNGPGLQPLNAITGSFSYNTSGDSGLINHYDAASSGTAVLKHEGDGADEHREKRFKAEPLPPLGGVLGVPVNGTMEPDFITRGVITEEEATMCFES